MSSARSSSCGEAPPIGMTSVKIAPWGEASSRVTRPSWARAIARTMDRPSPKPSSSSGTALRPNRSKICSRSPAGTPGPAVAHPEARRACRRTTSRGRRRRRRCVCLTALSQSWSSAWVSRCSSTVAVTDAVSSSVHLPVAEAAGLGEHVDGEAGEVDGPRADEVGPVALGEQDQVADQAGHPVDLVEQQLAGLGDLLGAADVEQLEVAAQDGQRRLELVAGVVEELPLPDERRLEPVEHPVDGPGERGDVVVAGDREPAGQVGVGDLLGGLAQRAQRREQPAGLPGREARDEQQRQRRRRSRRSASCRAGRCRSGPGT